MSVRLGLELDLGLGVSGRVLGCVQYAVRDAVAPVAAHVTQGAHIGTEARGAAITHHEDEGDLVHGVAVLGVQGIEVAALDPVAKGGEDIHGEVPVA